MRICGWNIPLCTSCSKDYCISLKDMVAMSGCLLLALFFSYAVIPLGVTYETSIPVIVYVKSILSGMHALDMHVNRIHNK